MKKVLFVCLGNICRSPMAEGIFKNLVKEEGLENEFYIDSAATSDYHIDEEPDERMQETAREHELKLESRGRQIDHDDLKYFDIILAMDAKNKEDILALNDHHRSKIFLMRDFDSVNKGEDVPDPYFGEVDGFKEVYDILDRSCRNLLSNIKGS